LETPQWYYVVDGNQMGPVTKQALVQRLASGPLSAETLVWTESLDEWVPAASLGELTAPVPPPVEPPVFGASAAALEPAASEIIYAGFWMRVAASLIDGFVLMFAGFIVGGLVGVVYGLLEGSSDGADGVGVVVGIFIRWFYFARMESSVYQATLGKMALGLKVTDVDGAPLSFSRATGRHVAKLASTLTLGAGYLMVAFTERKQGLHDIIASCLVVRR
jgi:uncharacterized RDD family membrane protein YckC